VQPLRNFVSLFQIAWVITLSEAAWLGGKTHGSLKSAHPGAQAVRISRAEPVESAVQAQGKKRWDG